MPKKPKLLFVGDFETQDDSVRRSLEEQFQIVTVANLWRAVHLLRQDTFDVIHVLESPKTSLLQISDIKFNSLVLESMPDGVVLLDAENKIVWHNNSGIGTNEEKNIFFSGLQVT